MRGAEDYGESADIPEGGGNASHPYLRLTRSVMIFQHPDSGAAAAPHDWSAGMWRGVVQTHTSLWCV